MIWELNIYIYIYGECGVEKRKKKKKKKIISGWCISVVHAPTHTCVTLVTCRQKQLLGQHKTIDTRIPTSCNHTATYRLHQRRDKHAISSRYMDQHQ